MVAIALNELADFGGGSFATTVDDVCIFVSAGSGIYGIVAAATSWNPIGWVVGGLDAICAAWTIGRGIQYFSSKE